MSGDVKAVVNGSGSLTGNTAISVKKRLMGNRKSNYTRNDEIYTPPEIFEALGVEFDLDVAAPLGGLSWIPTKKSLSIENDALKMDWKGFVWMNPPYSESTFWVNKFIDHKNGIALLPFSKANWMVKLWDTESACIFINKVEFLKPDLTRHDIFMACGLWGIGETAVNALKNCNIGKVR